MADQTSDSHGPAPSITVVGHATVEAVPDEARLAFHLSGSGRSAEAALAAVGERVSLLGTILKQAGVDEANQGQTVSVSEQGEQKGGRWLTKGYEASATLRTIIKAPETVGEIIATSVQQVGPRISGPQWVVSPEHPVRAESWRAAALEAKQRAEAYAEALGLQLGSVLEVSENGITDAPRDHRMSGPAMMAAQAVVESAPSFELRPIAQNLHASVTVRFAI